MLSVSMPKRRTSSWLVDTATKWLATAASSLSAARHHSLAVWAFLRVSRVVKVLELTMNRVSAGSSPWVVSAKSVASTLETKPRSSDRSL